MVEVRTRSEPKLLPDMTGRSTHVSGEAVAVDLPRGQTLFATLVGEDTGYPEEIAISSLVSPAERETHTGAEVVQILSQTGRRGLVPRRAYPLMVRFRDPRDPLTVEGVNPDNLAAAFGAGIRLKRVTIQTVASMPSFSLQNRLPWLGRQFQAQATASNGIGMVLRSDAFQQR